MLISLTWAYKGQIFLPYILAVSVLDHFPEDASRHVETARARAANMSDLKDSSLSSSILVTKRMQLASKAQTSSKPL